jgi:hypothetical protein
MQADIAIGNKKSCGEPGKGYQPIRVSEANVRGTRPDFPLISHDVLDGSQAQFVFFRIASLMTGCILSRSLNSSGGFGILFCIRWIGAL